MNFIWGIKASCAVKKGPRHLLEETWKNLFEQVFLFMNLNCRISLSLFMLDYCSLLFILLNYHVTFFRFFSISLSFLVPQGINLEGWNVTWVYEEEAWLPVQQTDIKIAHMTEHGKKSTVALLILIVIISDRALSLLLILHSQFQRLQQVSPFFFSGLKYRVRHVCIVTQSWKEASWNSTLTSIIRYSENAGRILGSLPTNSGHFSAPYKKAKQKQNNNKFIVACPPFPTRNLGKQTRVQTRN